MKNMKKMKMKMSDKNLIMGAYVLFSLVALCVLGYFAYKYRKEAQQREKFCICTGGKGDKECVVPNTGNYLNYGSPFLNNN